MFWSFSSLHNGNKSFISIFGGFQENRLLNKIIEYKFNQIFNNDGMQVKFPNTLYLRHHLYTWLPMNKEHQ